MAIQESSLSNQIGELYKRVKEYRSSETFRNFLSLCATFKKYSFYNCMLAHTQMPGARYILTEYEWKKRYGRLVKTDSRPIVILKPFGPVQLIYDISQTVSNDWFGTEDEAWEKFVDPFSQDSEKLAGIVDIKKCDKLVKNLPYYGISFDMFETGSTYGGKLEVGNYSDPIIKFLVRGQTLKAYPSYTIKCKSGMNKAQQFEIIAHELGHLFCRHMYCMYETKWECRELSHAAKEFEAQTVAWLVCNRQNIPSSSCLYLSTYLENNKEIPDININEIIKAATLVENMLETMNVKDGYFYKYNPRFREKVDAIEKPGKILFDM